MRETNRRRPAVRLSALLLALGLVLLPGCRPGDEDVTTITFVHGWGSTEADHEIMRRIFSDFEAQNPGIRLNMLSLPTENDMIRKTGDMLMVGTVPDVVCLSGKGLDTIYKFMVERGCALDLMPRLRPFTHSIMVSREVPPRKRCPSSQVAPLVRLCRFVALEPIPLLPEVQKGTIVLPLKS